jgi:hypothetical protein
VTDLRSWGRKWNEAALRRIAASQERSPSRTWPLLGILALGLVAGAALGGYAMSQRSHMKRLAMYAGRLRVEPGGMGGGEDPAVSTVTVPRSNHGRKATSEV